MKILNRKAGYYGSATLGICTCRDCFAVFFRWPGKIQADITLFRFPAAESTEDIFLPASLRSRPPSPTLIVLPLFRNTLVYKCDCTGHYQGSGGTEVEFNKIFYNEHTFRFETGFKGDSFFQGRTLHVIGCFIIVMQAQYEG